MRMRNSRRGASVHSTHGDWWGVRSRYILAALWRPWASAFRASSQLGGLRSLSRSGAYQTRVSCRVRPRGRSSSSGSRRAAPAEAVRQRPANPSRCDPSGLRARASGLYHLPPPAPSHYLPQLGPQGRRHAQRTARRHQSQGRGGGRDEDSWQDDDDGDDDGEET